MAEKLHEALGRKFVFKLSLTQLMIKKIVLPQRIVISKSKYPGIFVLSTPIYKWLVTYSISNYEMPVCILRLFKYIFGKARAKTEPAIIDFKYDNTILLVDFVL